MNPSSSDDNNSTLFRNFVGSDQNNADETTGDSYGDESAENVASPGLSERIMSCISGDELLVILKELPKTTGKGGLGLSFNRVIKVVKMIQSTDLISR